MMAKLLTTARSERDEWKERAERAEAAHLSWKTEAHRLEAERDAIRQSRDALQDAYNIAKGRLETYVNFHREAEALLDLVHKLGETFDSSGKPLLNLDCADDVTAEALKERLNALWELIKNGEPAPDKTGFVQIPAGRMRAASIRADTAERLLLETQKKLAACEEARRVLAGEQDEWKDEAQRATFDHGTMVSERNEARREKEALAAQVVQLRDALAKLYAPSGTSYGPDEPVPTAIELEEAERALDLAPTTAEQQVRALVEEARAAHTAWVVQESDYATYTPAPCSIISPLETEMNALRDASV